MIEAVTPDVDGGRFPAKRVAGDEVTVEADVFTDGHDLVACEVLYRREKDASWSGAAMAPLDNDRWQGTFRVAEVGRYVFTVRGWVDEFATWRRGLDKKAAAGQDVSVELLTGSALVRSAAERASAEDARSLVAAAAALAGDEPIDRRVEEARDARLSEAVARHPDRSAAATYERELAIVVDGPRARFSAWYELFPRSTNHEGRHGTFADVEALLPDIAAMGFDVLYLPPIHPIGRTHRKGPNNRPEAGPGDPGSPWAIGAKDGGHTAVHPELGTLADFRRLVEAARAQGLEIALDIAFQASPDHPWVREQPTWFRRRPDGTVQYAENPPKKYEDIYPFDFDSPGWRPLWEELKGVFAFWIGQGVRTFRVDNPHTKPFAFWEWLIGEVKRDHPDVIFLSEAFTRPKVMYRLAKLGFTQSYTYFAWRNERREIEEYFSLLTRPPVSEFFRPNLWPNTPDILTEYLQEGGAAACRTRLVLAATLGASYGVYGPAFELGENRPRLAGGEEYLDSEKYQIRRWDRGDPHGLRGLIARINGVRRDHPALQSDGGLHFHGADNERLICYSKATGDLSDVVLTVVNLDPSRPQSGWLDLDEAELGLTPGQPFEVLDLLSGARYAWQGRGNYVLLDPAFHPAHVFEVRR
ncbi:MAG TPA: alpha-1,4-glucan--maltose-1-phosphate maltosyltransferase [Vicinamibacteria bacterium]|nr:alpha-1,4-glucan--maltose-1-phosphate maltosyltransferase [Vicinamibacteria bacterium]